MKTRERPAVNNGQANNLAQVDNSSNPNRMNMTKWSIKEKLYLVSCVLVNGDSNWSRICNQLNKWMKFTSSYYGQSAVENFRTNNQCSKQYKFLISSYTKRYGISDLKKIYNELVEERLAELRTVVTGNQDSFSGLCTEIEQILTMDKSNFEELTKIWKTVKNQQIVDEDEQLIRDNLARISELQDKQAEREAALAIERHKAAEAQKRIERAKAREAEAQRRLAEQAETEKNEREKSEREALEKEALAKMRTGQVKAEKFEADNTEMDLFDKIRTSDMTKPIEIDEPKSKSKIICDENFDSDDEVSFKNFQKLSSTKEKSTSEQAGSSGIEWRPKISNESDKSSLKQSLASPNSSTHSNSMENKRKVKHTNRTNDLSTSESGLSDAGSSSESGCENGGVEKKKSKEGRQSKPVEELIFTPLITYEKKGGVKERSPLKKAALTDEEEIPTGVNETKKTLASPRKPTKTESDSPTVKKSSRFTRISESVAAEKSTESTNDEEELSENKPVATATLGRMSSLRSSNKPRTSLPIQTKRRSTITPKTVKSTANESSSGGLLSTESSDPGLVSIIKSEPVQIATESTVQDSTIATSVPTDVNLSISTRSARNQDSVPAPFSSSSTSSSLSNNSFSSKFEDEKAYRSWKKSIMMVFTNITCHKHATIFMQPVRDEIAPGYSSVVFRPMDLTTIKKNIETGVIKSTRVFQRDIMLMFTNAIMYNSANHDVHKISAEMYREVLNDIEQLVNAQENKLEEDSNIPMGKASRSKDKRLSTTSDRGVIMASGVGGNGGNNDSESVESEQIVSSISSVKTGRKSIYNTTKDEILEIGSTNSNSSIGAKTRGRGGEKKISSPSIVNNSKKRRPSSSESSQLKKELGPMVEPQSKKRRRSGR